MSQSSVRPTPPLPPSLSLSLLSKNSIRDSVLSHSPPPSWRRFLVERVRDAVCSDMVTELKVEQDAPDTAPKFNATIVPPFMEPPPQSPPAGGPEQSGRAASRQEGAQGGGPQHGEDAGHAAELQAPDA